MARLGCVGAPSSDDGKGESGTLARTSVANVANIHATSSEGIWTGCSGPSAAVRFAGQTVARKVAKVNNLNAKLAEEARLLQIVAGHPNVAQMFGGVETHSCCSSACAFRGLTCSKSWPSARGCRRRPCTQDPGPGTSQRARAHASLSCSALRHM